MKVKAPISPTNINSMEMSSDRKNVFITVFILGHSPLVVL